MAIKVEPGRMNMNSDPARDTTAHTLRQSNGGDRFLVEPSEFKQGMRRLASGVVIVATECDGQCHGLAATAVTSVTAEPPTLLVCVNRSASSHDALVRSGHFCVSVLGEADRDIAMRFGSSADRETRFVGREWRPLVTGSPALAGSLASFDCRLSEVMKSSTHTLLFGQVVALETWADEIRPLLYWDGAFRDH